MAEAPPISMTYVRVVMIVLSIVVVFFLVAHTLSGELLPNLTVDNTTLALLALLIFLWLLPIMRSVSLPGGTKIELKDIWPAVLAVRRLPPMDLPTEMTVRPPPVWRLLLPSDPKLSLAGLRVEIETNLRTLGAAFDLPPEARGENLFQVSRRLVSAGVVTPDEENALVAVSMACNQVVEAARVSDEAARTVADLGTAVLQVLDEKLAVSKPGAEK